jgi:MYXO-CTERM domain-containing protein
MAYRAFNSMDMADRLQLTNCDGVDGMSGLGFSLKPPKWLRNAVASAVKGQSVTVQTPSGPQEVKLDDPSAAKKFLQMAAPQVSFGPPGPQPNLIDQAAAAVPGGTTTLAVGALALVGLAAFAFSRRRRASR